MVPSRSKVSQSSLDIKKSVTKIIKGENNYQLHTSQAFELQGLIFWYMDNRIPTILTWYPSEELMNTNVHVTCMTYWPWYFNVFIVAGFIGFGSCVVVLFNSKSVTSSQLLISFLLASLSLLLWGSAILIIQNVQEITLGIKCLKTLVSHLRNAQRWKAASKFHWHNQRRPYWKKLIYGIDLVIVAVGFIPFFLIPCCLYVKLDPFYYTIPTLILPPSMCGSNRSCHVTLEAFTFFFRALLGCGCVFEACRFLSLYILTWVLYLELMMTSLDFLRKMSPGKSVDYLFLKWYSALQVADQTFTGSLSKMIALLMGDGFVIFVSCNAGSLKFYSRLPFLIYWLLPMVSFIVAVFVAVLLPFAASIDVMSRNVLKNRLNALLIGAKNDDLLFYARSHQLKILRRKYVAARPITLSVASLYPLKRGSEAIYYYWVFWRTVDLIMLPFFQ